MVNEKRLIKTFYDLVNIDSPSLKEGALSAYIVERLARLEIEAEADGSSNKTGSDTGNLYAYIEGVGDPILFNAHMDTIESTFGIETIEDDKTIRTDGKTILGADDKAGIAIILEMVEVLKERNIEHAPIELLFTVAEEIGLVGANALSASQIKSKISFCFDGGSNVKDMTMKAPYQDTIEAEFFGKAAHAGVEPEKGTNAIYAASIAISNFPQGRIDKETTANVGIIKGGKATNIVADYAKFSAEIRSHNIKTLEQTVSKVEAAINNAAKMTKTKAVIKRQTSFVGFSLEEDEPVVRIATEAMNELGIKASYATSGGGSDANVFNKQGIRTLTLSIGANNVHCCDEYLDKEELVKSAELAVKIVEKQILRA